MCPTNLTILLWRGVWTWTLYLKCLLIKCSWTNFYCIATSHVPTLLILIVALVWLHVRSHCLNYINFYLQTTSLPILVSSSHCLYTIQYSKSLFGKPSFLVKSTFELNWIINWTILTVCAKFEIIVLIFFYYIIFIYLFFSKFMKLLF